MVLRRRPFLRSFAIHRQLLRGVLLGGGLTAILLIGGASLTRDARGATDPARQVAPAADVVLDAAASSAADRDKGKQRLGFRQRLGRHVIHAVLTVERQGELLTYQIDRGKIASIGDGKLTIAEAGGSSVTVATNDQTRVRRDGKKSDLTALKAGDEVYVISRAESGDGEPIAIRIAAPTREAANS